MLSLPESEDITQSELNGNRTVYLLPDIESDKYPEVLLQEFYECHFEEQLSDWCTDEHAWPQHRALTMFKQWFDVEYHSIVLDLVGDALKDDETVT